MSHLDTIKVDLHKYPSGQLGWMDVLLDGRHKKVGDEEWIIDTSLHRVPWYDAAVCHHSVSMCVECEDEWATDYILIQYTAFDGISSLIL